MPLSNPMPTVAGDDNVWGTKNNATTQELSDKVDGLTTSVTTVNSTLTGAQAATNATVAALNTQLQNLINNPPPPTWG